MKRIVSLLFCAAALVCGLFAFPAFADTAVPAEDPGPVNTQPTGGWTINEYSEPFHTLFTGQDGTCWVNAGELCETLGGSFFADGTSAQFSLYGDSISLAAMSAKSYINEEEYDLSQVARFDNGGVYLELSDAGWLFYLTPTEGSDEIKYAYGFASTAPVYFYDTDYINTTLSADQLTVLQGISAPINTHNMIGATVKDVSGYVADSYTYLNGVTGAPRYGNLDGLKQVMDRDWGITDRDSLLTQLDWLFDEGHRTSFAADASAGALPDWFTQKWGTSFDSTALIGWDLGRAVQLAQWGYCVGYLDPVSALQYELAAAETLQSVFGDWTRYGQDCLLGYDYMLGTDAAGNDWTAMRAAIVADIYADNLYNGCSLDTPLPDADFSDGSSDSSSGEGWGSNLPQLPNTPDVGQTPATELTAGDFAPFLIITLVMNGLGAVIGIVIVTCQNRQLRRMRRPFDGRDPWNL